MDAPTAVTVPVAGSVNACRTYTPPRRIEDTVVVGCELNWRSSVAADASESVYARKERDRSLQK